MSPFSHTFLRVFRAAVSSFVRKGNGKQNSQPKKYFLCPICKTSLIFFNCKLLMRLNILNEGMKFLTNPLNISAIYYFFTSIIFYISFTFHLKKMSLYKTSFKFI
ncbi:hypothetical protein FFZ99_12075 [Leptospira interrogans]|nr:hypothetical protein B2G47_03000 [Leptospira interrogans serovar Canicola]EJO80587.1 hypothetical protein LEP1GSC045_1638 [Leptospira interrogans serovar Pomona str. Kennewicki LC82-25]EKO71027.1 hypothetical protein LEP1GSC069_2417 [Leptospira interrogans serovar Canicola str. Fiocruz LV133]EKO86029.1 hypothetical protein LEP1GSC009_0628 [Leptospira interrogans serovar Grippotyphosa str. Andaman]EKP83581.1 hypothetical protein LEP1GSC020_3323 [Leptospira interrogans serovar Grippotyphosa st